MIAAAIALAAAPDVAEPGSIGAIVDEGDACIMRHAYPEAVRKYAEAASRAPTHPGIRRRLIVALMRAGEIPLVLEQASALLHLAPTDGESVRLIASLYMGLHRQSQVLLVWPGEPERVDTAAAGYPLPFFLPLAPVFLPEAEALARLAVENDPSSTSAQRTLAEILAESGQCREAIVAARIAHEGGDRPEGTLMLARQLARVGRWAEAKRTLLSPEILALAPTFATGRQFIAHISPEGAAVAPDADGIGGAATAFVRTVPVHLLQDGRHATRPVPTVHAQARCTRVSDADVIGAQFLPVLSDGTALVHDVLELAELHLTRPISRDWLPPANRACTVLAYDRAAGSLWMHVPSRSTRRVPRAALLATNEHANYCHWLLGSLPRLLIAGEMADAEQAPWIVPHALAPFQIETLDLLGVPQSRRLGLREDEAIRVDSLIVSRNPLCGGTPSPDLVRGIRRRLLGGDTPDVGRRRLYLSRRNASPKRTLLNEAEVEAMFIERGFEVVDTARLTVREQIALFREAALIAGPSGAAFSNLLFAPPGCRALATVGLGWMTPVFSALADVLGQDLLQILGTERPGAISHPHWNYAVSLDDVRRGLEWLGA